MQVEQQKKRKKFNNQSEINFLINKILNFTRIIPQLIGHTKFTNKINQFLNNKRKYFENEILSKNAAAKNVSSRFY